MLMCAPPSSATTVGEPFPFDAEYRQALMKPLAGAGPVRFVSIGTLIRMKEAAGRTQDRVDVEHLQMRLRDETDDA